MVGFGGFGFSIEKYVRMRYGFGPQRGGGLLALSIGCILLMENGLRGGHLAVNVRFCALFARFSTGCLRWSLAILGFRVLLFLLCAWRG